MTVYCVTEICMVFLKKRSHLDGSIFCSKAYVAFSIDGAFPHVQATSSIGTNAPSYHERCRLLT